MTTFRKDFKLDSKIAYLNSGSLSISPKVVVDALIKNTLEYEKNPTRSLFQTWGRMWKVQKSVALFLNASPFDLFLRANVTDVLNDFLLGIPLKKGGEIISPDLEYGAIVNILKYRAQIDGCSYRQFQLTDDPNAIVGQIESELKPNTEVLLLSHVVTGTGMILPIEEIAKVTSKKGVRLIVDGAHSPGSLPLDFSKYGNLDFYGGNLHKWMLGPKGTSFGWVHPKHQKDLYPRHIGWTSFETPGPFQPFGEENRFTCRWMLSACNQFAPFFALEELMNYWKKRGPQKIRKALYSNQYLLEDAIDKKLGWKKLSPQNRVHRGPLLSYHLPTPLSHLGWDFMKILFEKHQIQVMTPLVRGEFKLRLAPHVFNTEQEIKKTVAALQKMQEKYC